jgi:hypothetical protein
MEWRRAPVRVSASSLSGPVSTASALAATGITRIHSSRQRRSTSAAGDAVSGDRSERRCYNRTTDALLSTRSTAPSGPACAVGDPRRRRDARNEAQVLPRSITSPVVSDGMPSGHPVPTGCVLPRRPLFRRDPALADDQPRLMKGLPRQPGHTLQSVVAARRRRAHARGRLSGRRRNLGAQPIEQWLQRIHGQ